MIRIEIQGPALFSDLLAKRVRDEYNTLVGLKIPFDEAEKIVIDGFKGEFLPAHESVFWLALAYTEQHYGKLSELAKKKALAAIDSGEDLKKWEDAAAYYPYHQYSTHNRNISEELLMAGAEKAEIIDTTDPVTESNSKFQRDMMRNMMAKYPEVRDNIPFNKRFEKKRRKPVEPVEKPFEPDEMTLYIMAHSLEECGKKLGMRRAELQKIREFITNPPENLRKPKKSDRIRHCPWEAGDVVVMKTHKNKLSKYHGTCYFEDDMYEIMVVLKVIRQPVSMFVPVTVASEDDAVVGFYDYYSDAEPTAEMLDSIPFFKFSGFGGYHTGVHLGFYQSSVFEKNTQWKVIKHYDNFPDEIPQFFRDGIMGSRVVNFSHEIFDIVTFERRNNKKE